MLKIKTTTVVQNRIKNLFWTTSGIVHLMAFWGVGKRSSESTVSDLFTAFRINASGSGKSSAVTRFRFSLEIRGPTGRRVVQNRIKKSVLDHLVQDRNKYIF